MRRSPLTPHPPETWWPLSCSPCSSPPASPWTAPSSASSRPTVSTATPPSAAPTPTASVSGAAAALLSARTGPWPSARPTAPASGGTTASPPHTAAAQTTRTSPRLHDPWTAPPSATTRRTATTATPAAPAPTAPATEATAASAPVQQTPLSATLPGTASIRDSVTTQMKLAASKYMLDAWNLYTGVQDRSEPEHITLYHSLAIYREVTFVNVTSVAENTKQCWPAVVNVSVPYVKLGLAENQCSTRPRPSTFHRQSWPPLHLILGGNLAPPRTKCPWSFKKRPHKPWGVQQFLPSL